MSRSQRLLPLLLALLGVAVLVTPLTLARATPPVAQQALSGVDYATSVWQDPFDFSNPSDILLDNGGPASGLIKPTVGSGLLTFSISTSGYLSPLWAGYPGSLRLGRDGALAANMINAGAYTRVHLHVYTSASVSISLFWFTCGAPTSSCMGGMHLPTLVGWNDIDALIANDARYLSKGKAWSGKIQGLRLGLRPHSSAVVRMDTLRIYQPVATSNVTWTSPNNSPAKLWWTDGTGTFVPITSQHAGPVAGASAPNGSTKVSTNVAGYPPNTRFWAVGSGGAMTYIGQTAPAPRPIVDSPSVAGCASHLWKFTSPRSLAGYGNATSLGFTSTGRLSAVNAAPHRNDPYIYLPIGPSGIDGRVYHRLTIVESYAGRFDLHNAPGGGTMGRVMWQSAGHTVLAQTADILTYSGKRMISIDMATPASVLTESDGTAAQRYAFASTARVMKLRWDPNEDPGARHWNVFSIRLAADCSTRTSFAVTWHDASFMPGSTVRIEARPTSGARPTTVGRTTERSGANTFTINARSLPAGPYRLRVYVTNPAGVTVGGTSTGPLVVSH